MACAQSSTASQQNGKALLLHEAREESKAGCNSRWCWCNSGHNGLDCGRDSSTSWLQHTCSGSTLSRTSTRAASGRAAPPAWLPACVCAPASRAPCHLAGDGGAHCAGLMVLCGWLGLRAQGGVRAAEGRGAWWVAVQLWMGAAAPRVPCALSAGMAWGMVEHQGLLQGTRDCHWEQLQGPVSPSAWGCTPCAPLTNQPGRAPLLHSICFTHALLPTLRHGGGGRSCYSCCGCSWLWCCFRGHCRPLALSAALVPQLRRGESKCMPGRHSCCCCIHACHVALAEP